ncbi:PP2C-domain-containing protein [Dentipellis sp. KUC8613]|nr:PP2C-domain-containing protein [Dentipellis sp. KUC8613]
MGQTLSSPATEKHTESAMEDAHATELRLDEGDETNTFFAVYDGHGGSSVARFAGTNVHKRLVKEEAYREGNYPEALKRSFLGTDEDLLGDPSFTRDPSGCTAVAALITKDKKIFVANAGDSRTVLSVKGEVKPLSFDHKPQNETEKNRVWAAGGFIEFGRVMGNLALARALGDFEYKKDYKIPPEDQIITSNPEITQHDITDDDEFLVLACDGIWDCLSSQQVVNIVRLQVSEGKELPEICENICELCLAPDTTSGAGIGCDNMTAMIVALLNGKTKEEWYAMIKERVQNHVGYATPDTLPQIYATTRLLSFKARRQAMEERDRILAERESPKNEDDRTEAFGLFSSGGISFTPGIGIYSGTPPNLMFEQDDSDEDENMGQLTEDRMLFNKVDFTADSPDVTKSLKEQLDEFERDEVDKESDGDFKMDEADDEALKEPFDSVIDLSKAEQDRAENLAQHHSPSSPSPTETQSASSTTPGATTPASKLQGEAPPPPKPLVNGNALPEQLHTVPGGDAPHPAVKAEGLLDHSEDPLKG